MNSPLYPQNRKEVFFDLLKNHKLDLVKINLFVALFAFLSIATIYLFILLIGFVPTLISSGDIEMIKADDMDYSILATSIIYLILLFAILIITNIPAFIGMGGGVYVLSKLCYAEENTIIGKDFFIGIKRNIKQSILLSLLFSITCLFSVSVVSIYLIMDTYLIVKVISNIIAISVFIIVSIVIFIAFNYMNTYQTNFIGLIKNSFLIAFSHPIKTIGLMLLSMVLYFLLFIPMRFPVFALVNIFFGFSYFLVIEILYTTSLFDLYINKKGHPEIVDKGLRK